MGSFWKWKEKLRNHGLRESSGRCCDSALYSRYRWSDSIGSLDTWGEVFGKASRNLRWDDVDGVTVSTVFLGLDHNFGWEGPPILWETMIFGGEHDQYQERYSSADEAEIGHERALALVKGPEEKVTRKFRR